MNIAIDRDTSLVYEAQSNWGHPVWPSPILLQVAIASVHETIFQPAKYNVLPSTSLIFREETYDLSSRIRRGRIYQADQSIVQQWNVWPHPALGTEIGIGPYNRKHVYAFQSIRLRHHLKLLKIDQPVLLLGSEDGFTIWTLVNIETSAIGDEMITLRARKSGGALPELDREKILSNDGVSVIEYIDKLEEEIFRAGADSVVDRCREAASSILSKYLQSKGKVNPGLDLGGLADKIAEEKLEIVANAARIISRLHPRGKHSEQEKRKLRQLTEQDAEFAIQAVGIILCDLGWAKW
ncbi:MAG: hypothetical protein HY272_09405 [Gammaproteobacteria bacterium]|nr:hypothetical protein [Gammaproteobacteria bacterium]